MTTFTKLNLQNSLDYFISKFGIKRLQILLILWFLFNQPLKKGLDGCFDDTFSFIPNYALDYYKVIKQGVSWG